MHVALIHSNGACRIIINKIKKHYGHITCPPIKSQMADDRSMDLKSRPVHRLLTTFKG